MKPRKAVGWCLPLAMFFYFWQFNNDEGDSLGTNTRMRWTFNPLGELFVVYNQNLVRSVHDRTTRVWDFDPHELLMKLRNWWRFEVQGGQRC